MAKKKTIKMNITDYIDQLNLQALELAKYEGFYPDKYLITKKDKTSLTMNIVPTNNVETAVPNYEIKVSLLDDMEKQWFIHAAFAQTVIYKAVQDIIEEFNKKENVWTAKKNKFVIADKKKFKKDIIQDQLDVIELSTFRTLKPFDNLSIADFVKPKKEESIDTIKQKIDSLARSVTDSISRLNYFDKAPSFNQEVIVKDNKESINLTLNKSKMFNTSINWKTIKLDQAYNLLIEYCKVAKAVLNTLEFYRSICDTNEPRIFVSKLFGKKWKITTIGNEYMDCLQIEDLIKELYNIK